MKFLVFSLFTMLCAPVLGQDLLADKISEITMPEYTLEEKKTTLENVILLAEQANVNRRIKIEKYGKAIDPVPRLKALRPQLEELSTMVLQKQIAEIIASQRDLHLSFTLPKPYACYRGLLPFWLDLFFKQNSEGGLKAVVAVKRVFNNNRYQELMTDTERSDFAKIKVGDLLLEYDGIDFSKDVAQALRPFFDRGKGANSHAGLLRAARSLTNIYFSGAVHDFYDSTENPRQQVILKLQNGSGQVYQVRIPWFVRASQRCLESLEAQEPSDEDLADDLEIVDQELVADELESFQLHSSIDFINDPKQNKDQYGFRWGLIRHFGANYGYVAIPGFTPRSQGLFPWPDDENKGKGATDEDLLENFMEIIQVMNTEHQVRGLVIDVRNNGGGSLLFSESFVQFFSKNKVSPKKYRLLNSPFNRAFHLNADPEANHLQDHFVGTMADAGESKVYGKAVPFLGDRGKFYDNRFGQIFFKPVVVLTNSACYSACDGFTAMMQDSRSAKIWSEGRRTGGGGANVVGDAYFRNFMEDNYKLASFNLKPFPHGQSMRVPWRQIIRTGLNAGKRLEEDGVVADRSFLPTHSDLLNKKNFLLDELIEHFETENWMQSLEYSVEFPEYLFEVSMNADSVKIPMAIQGVGHIRVEQEPYFQYYKTVAPLEEIAFNVALDGDHLTKLEIPLPKNKQETWVQYRITGKQSSQVLFNKVIWVQRNPKPLGL